MSSQKKHRIFATRTNRLSGLPVRRGHAAERNAFMHDPTCSAFAKLSLREKTAYGMGDVACNVVFALTASLLVYFYTNVMHVPVGLVGTIMMASRVFDGISDITIGALIDRTHSKHGKARAWILWMMIPYGVSAVLLFTVPPGGNLVKGIYIFITYNFCTTFVYTALNLPYATLASLMTRDTNERAVVNLFRTGMSAIGNMIITGITFPLVDLLGDTQAAWIKVSLAYAVLAVAMLYFCFANCRERVCIPSGAKRGRKLGLWRECGLVLQNRYFFMFFALAVFLSLYETITGTSMAYYAQYILGDRNLTGLLAAFESVPQLLIVLVLAPLILRFGKRNVALAGACAAVLGMAAMSLSPGNQQLALAACALRGIGKGCFRGVKYAMLSDIIEYGHWKTGVRLEGMIVAAATAGQKFGGGLTVGLTGWLMHLAGFDGQEIISAAAVGMIRSIYIWGNVLAWGLIGFTLIFYKLDRLYPQIIHDLRQREHISQKEDSEKQP